MLAENVATSTTALIEFWCNVFQIYNCYLIFPLLNARQNGIETNKTIIDTHGIGIFKNTEGLT